MKNHEMIASIKIDLCNGSIQPGLLQNFSLSLGGLVCSFSA